MAELSKRKRLINRRRQGDLGEASAVEWLTSVGATVLVPFGHSPDYDLVAEVEGRLLRIQVKTSTFTQSTPNGHSRAVIQLATNGGNQSWSGVAKRFDPSRFDLLFVLTGDGRRWCIPSTRIEGETAISVGGPKYSEFEIERGRPIRDLVYGIADSSLESKSRRGSADVGESGETVNLVLIAERVRIPPPPSAGLPASNGATPSDAGIRGGQTRISSHHQVTIPRFPFRAAGLDVGDRLRVWSEGDGRVVLQRIDGPTYGALGLFNGDAGSRPEG